MHREQMQMPAPAARLPSVRPQLLFFRDHTERERRAVIRRRGARSAPDRRSDPVAL